MESTSPALQSEVEPEPEPKKLKMSTTSDDDAPTADPSSVDRKPRYKRRKVAIFLAYCGVGYQGMQKNPGAKTIEGELEEALYHSGGVPENDRGKPQRFDWARSARTDKGVSAVGQVVSGRFYIDPPGFVDRLNSHLPNQIRIFGFKRVTNSFSAKKFCDRRRYVYLIPVFALDHTSHPNRENVLASLGSENELVKCLECSERGRKIAGVMGRRCRESKMDENESRGSESVVVEVKEDGSECHKVQCGNVDEKGVSENANKAELASGVLQSAVVELKEDELECHSVQCRNADEKGVSRNANKTELPSGPGISESAAVEDKEDGLECHSLQCGNVDEKSVSRNGNKAELASGVSEASMVETREETMQVNSVQCSDEEEKGVSENGGGFYYGEKEKEKFNRILSHYLGTHNFHNFTTRIKAEDPSAIRYIISFTANTVVTVDGMDFVKCEVVGQSFMLHQIRKLIGLAVAIMRNCAPESLIDIGLKKDVNITVPTAPEVGLYLDECFFPSYNQKWRESHEEISMEAFAEQAEDFKMKQVYSHIAAMEQKEGSVAVWLHSLNYRNYPDLQFGEDNVVTSSGVEVNGTGTNGENVQVDNMGKEVLVEANAS